MKSRVPRAQKPTPVNYLTGNDSQKNVEKFRRKCLKFTWRTPLKIFYTFLGSSLRILKISSTVFSYVLVQNCIHPYSAKSTTVKKWDNAYFCPFFKLIQVDNTDRRIWNKKVAGLESSSHKKGGNFWDVKVEFFQKSNLLYWFQPHLNFPAKEACHFSLKTNISDC